MAQALLPANVTDQVSELHGSTYGRAGLVGVDIIARNGLEFAWSCSAMDKTTDASPDRRPTRPVEIVKSAARDFRDDRVVVLAASLAFYTSLSLAPLLVLMLWFLSMLTPGAEAHLIEQATSLMGGEAEKLVRSVLENAEDGINFRSIAGVISIVTLLFSATGVFAQLQFSLNRIWDVRARPGLGFLGWVRRRILTMAMVGALAFLVLVSLIASTALSTLGFSEDGGWVSRTLGIAASTVVFTLLFASVYRLLPDVVMRWRDVLGGAAITAVLFSAGKLLIGVYLARKGLGNTYGAAGSVIVVLSWVYFSSIVVFAGAELTQSWLKSIGRTIKPNRWAVIDEARGDATPAAPSTVQA